MTKRRVQLTDEELSRWNYLRWRAGEDPIDKTLAEGVLSNVDEQTYREMMERLR
jgi:hypothetical protein